MGCLLEDTNEDFTYSPLEVEDCKMRSELPKVELLSSTEIVIYLPVGIGKFRVCVEFVRTHVWKTKNVDLLQQSV